MASSNSAAFIPPNFSNLISIKLTSSNYLLWVSQITPVLSCHDLIGFVDGSESCPSKYQLDEHQKETTILNPAFVTWNKKDQCVLSLINATLSESVLGTVYGLKTARQAWTALAARMASHSRSRVTHLKRQLQNLKQGSKSCLEYIQGAKHMADQLSAVGKPVDDEDLISYIVSGLNSSFTPFVTSYSFATRDSVLSLQEFQDELMNYETLLEHHNQSVISDTGNFAMFANKPGQFSSNRNNNNNKKGRGSFSAKRSNTTPNGSQFGQSTLPKQVSNQDSTPFRPSRPSCQICGRNNHQALDCYHRMDFSFQGRHPPAQLAAMAAHTHVTQDDQPWFADSGANTHITSAMENLSLQQQYQGNEEVAVGNGASLQISGTGSISLPNNLNLQRVLYCPNAAANLLSIQKFCQDNDCYFLLTSSDFVVKDSQTGRILLQGQSEDGLYPIRFSKQPSHPPNKFTAFLGVKTTFPIWHNRLGHPTMLLVQHLLKQHNLPVIG